MGYCSWEIPSQKVCEVGWSNKHQGLAEQIRRYRNSPVMHDSVPDEYKPMLFRKGIRQDFPAPTQMLKRPKGAELLWLRRHLASALLTSQYSTVGWQLRASLESCCGRILSSCNCLLLPMCM